MDKVSFKVTSYVSDVFGNKNYMYTFDNNDTIDDVLDHLSIKYNYNYFLHKKSILIHTEKDKYKASFHVKDITMNLGELPCKENMVIYISMSPNTVGANFEKGYNRENKYQDENEEPNK